MTDSLVFFTAVVATVVSSWLGILYRRLQRTSEAERARLESLLASQTQQFETVQANLKRSNDLALEALAGALDLRTAGGSNQNKRVCAFTIALARAMGIPREEIKAMAEGAFLRDIGKIGIPDQILFKSSALTDEEMIVMEGHCYLGYELILPIPYLVQAAEIVYAHHERYDGLGYPRRLKGNQIPIGARLVSVAEALGSMIFIHPARQEKILQAAREEIEMSAWSRFDPEIVSVFLQMPGYVWFDLIQEIDKGSDGFRQ